MAHLHYNLSIVVKGAEKEYRTIKVHHIHSTSTKWKKTQFHNMNFTNQTTNSKNNKTLVHSCSTSSTSTSSDHQLNLSPDNDEKLDPIKKLQFGYYLVSDVNWQVRRMVETEEEMKKVADVQAEAFHEPVFLFDDLFFEFFKAEVLSGLLYRLRNSPPDRYACLVAEARNDPQESQKELVGVVDVTVQREDSVLQHLPGAQEYLYISGIAVLNKFRRQKVGTTLLRACDILSDIWGFEYLVLRAYEDDYGAQRLYSSAGYRVVSRDPPWTTTWIGRRRRVLMIKRITRAVDGMYFNSNSI